MQAAGVEEEEEVVVVEAIVSVDMERGLDMAAARCFIALPRARGGHSADPRPVQPNGGRALLLRPAGDVAARR